MVDKFKDHDGREHRAVQAWQILLGAAHNRQTLTYDDMSELMDYGIGRNVKNALDPIYRYCEENDLPPLTALVVGVRSGIHRKAIVESFPSIPKVQADVYAREGYAVYPSTAEQIAKLIGH